MEDIVRRLEELRRRSDQGKIGRFADKCVRDAIDEIRSLRKKLEEKKFFQNMNLDELMEIIDSLEDNKQVLIKIRNAAVEETCID